jgi:hypothetical protein
MPRMDARSTSTCPMTMANDHNPSIPPIGGEGRLHDSAGPPIFCRWMSAWGGSRTRALGLEGPSSTARLPTLRWGTRPRILESFLGSRLRSRGSLFQECLKLIDRREEILHVLAFVFQIPRDSPGVRDRLLRQPLPRFLPEFGRRRPFHSSACHRASRLTIVSPKSRRAYLAPLSQRPCVDEFSRLSTAATHWRYL